MKIVDATAMVQCETHHWTSTNVPGLLSRWVIQCSLCEAYNVEEMNAAAVGICALTSKRCGKEEQ